MLRMEARNDGWQVNNKRVNRLWREEGLKVPYRKGRRTLRGIGAPASSLTSRVPQPRSCFTQ